MSERRAEIHEVPDAAKHGYWVGKPLFVVAILEGKRIFDVSEEESLASGIEWAKTRYGLDAVVVP